MTRLTFTLLSEPPERLDLTPLTPRKLAGMSRGEMEKTPIGLSRSGLAVGDIFRASEGEGEGIVFEGGSSRFDCLGSGMAEGTIRVLGDVGAQAGRKMSGGSLIVEGSAGPHAGSAMSGGRLEITGDADDFAGGPLSGELVGMSGGMLIVRGHAGSRTGDRMRRGLLAVLRGCGDYPGSRMIAGTLAIAGGVGRMPGYLMRRGSILLDRRPAALSPSFIETGAWDSVFASLIDRHLIEAGVLERRLLGETAGRYCGDNAVLGKGEILFALR